MLRGPVSGRVEYAQPHVFHTDNHQSEIVDVGSEIRTHTGRNDSSNDKK
jgi:hypothetical protein